MTQDAGDAEREANERDVRRGIAAIQAISFADAISESSRRYRRTLYVLALAAIVLASYPVKLAQIPWLSIPAPEDGGELVPSLLLVALVYQWISFFTYGLVDLLKWKATVTGEAMQAHAQVLYRLNNHLHTLSQAVAEREMRERGALPENIQATAARARSAADDAIGFYNSFASAGRRLTLFKRIMGWFWEFALPLLAGVWAGVLLLLELLDG